MAKKEKKRTVFMYLKNGPFVREFASVQEASRSLGISKGSIYNCLSGRSFSAGNYDFYYEKLNYGIDES